MDVNGLFRISATRGPETTVMQALPSGLWGGWAVLGRTVIYAALHERNREVPAELRLLDLETGKSRTPALVTELERQGSEIHLQPEH